MLVREKGHAGTEDTCDVHTVITAEVQVVNRQTVHGAPCHTNIARCDRRAFCGQINIFIFSAAKNRNRVLVFSGSNNTHHVADVDRVLSMRTNNRSVMQQSRADKGTADKVAELLQLFTF